MPLSTFTIQNPLPSSSKTLKFPSLQNKTLCVLSTLYPVLPLAGPWQPLICLLSLWFYVF